MPDGYVNQSGSISKTSKYSAAGTVMNFGRSKVNKFRMYSPIDVAIVGKIPTANRTSFGANISATKRTIKMSAFMTGFVKVSHTVYSHHLLGATDIVRR